MTSRTYSTRRYAIVNSVVELLKQQINGTGGFRSDINRNVFSKLKFFQDITDFPAICVTAGTETREYQAGGYRDRYLELKIMVFINEENPLAKCEEILEDIETLIEANSRLRYTDSTGVDQYTHDITILSISTDEGTLEPISVGELTAQVHY